ncbi:hypothetical protein TcWFU_003997 [Taenia crassiceps]|uniref:Uncharacterized protein n=1 Tax=Taenia crassiceps TaxID=6207 RepID=A0ABR4Q810_9CEST
MPQQTPQKRPSHATTRRHQANLEGEVHPLNANLMRVMEEAEHSVWCFSSAELLVVVEVGNVPFASDEETL